MSKGGPTDFNYITPEELFKIQKHGSHTLEDLQRLASERGTCENCGLPAWRYGGVGMCFPCTTGESDASDDYELISTINT